MEQPQTEDLKGACARPPEVGSKHIGVQGIDVEEALGESPRPPEAESQCTQGAHNGLFANYFFL